MIRYGGLDPDEKDSAGMPVRPPHVKLWQP